MFKCCYSISGFVICKVAVAAILRNSIIAGFFALPCTAEMEGVELPRVLLIGDSISIGYTEPVQRMLEGKADVRRIPGNARSSGFVREHLEKWLGDESWQVIHFNCGIHDAKLPPEGINHAPLDLYEENLRTIVTRLQQTDAHLIWASSTPIPFGGYFRPTRRFGDIDSYNQVAYRVMSEMGIDINDLNAAISSHSERFWRPRDLHFTDEGSVFLAKQVSESILSALSDQATSAVPKNNTLSKKTNARPNFVVIYTDDQRWDAMGAAGNDYIHTPNLDRLAREGIYFPNTFVTLSICSPSRAALLTGRYGSANGVMDVSAAALHDTERTIAHLLKDEGYTTAVTGKWHLPNSPRSLGFDYEFYFEGITQFWNVTFHSNGVKIPTEGFIEDRIVDASTGYLRKRDKTRPFFLWVNTFAPHMESNFSWSPKAESYYRYRLADAPLPMTWEGLNDGKPPYLETDRARQQALYYGYDDPASIREHVRLYSASVTDMDAAIGDLMEEIDRLGLSDNTYILIMGDNGWFMGEHGFTSKVLAYEESIRVPFIALGPGLNPSVNENLVLNIDILPTMLDLAGASIPGNVHGRSIKQIFDNPDDAKLRDAFLYEAFLSPEETTHTTYPHLAVRTHDWKYIATFDPQERGQRVFEELYDLRNDPDEISNLADNPDFSSRMVKMRNLMEREREAIQANP